MVLFNKVATCVKLIQVATDKLFISEIILLGGYSFFAVFLVQYFFGLSFFASLSCFSSFSISFS